MSLPRLEVDHPVQVTVSRTLFPLPYTIKPVNDSESLNNFLIEIRLQWGKKTNKKNVSLKTSLSLFAGWHDLGVQKYQISKEMTHKEKAGPRTAVTVQGQTFTVTNNL